MTPLDLFLLWLLAGAVLLTFAAEVKKYGHLSCETCQPALQPFATDYKSPPTPLPPKQARFLAGDIKLEAEWLQQQMGIPGHVLLDQGQRGRTALELQRIQAAQSARYRTRGHSQMFLQGLFGSIGGP